MCILETNRVERWPEKSAASSDFGVGRGQIDEKLGFEGTGRDFAAFRGKGEGLERETLLEAQYRLLLWLSRR